MKRKPRAAASGILYLRCSAELLAALDALAVDATARSGYPATRSDVARKALADAARAEGKLPPAAREAGHTRAARTA